MLLMISNVEINYIKRQCDDIPINQKLVFSRYGCFNCIDKFCVGFHQNVQSHACMGFSVFCNKNHQ